MSGFELEALRKHSGEGPAMMVNLLEFRDRSQDPKSRSATMLSSPFPEDLNPAG